MARLCTGFGERCQRVAREIERGRHGEPAAEIELALARALFALVFGTESMVVFRDVLPLPEARARKVKSWMIRTLVRAALKDSRP